MKKRVLIASMCIGMSLNSMAATTQGRTFIKDVIPYIYFDDETYTGSSASATQWDLYADVNSDGSLSRFELLDILSYDNAGTSYGTVMSFTSKGDGNISNSLIVDSSGDISLADGSVFIDKSENRLGIGTATPQNALDVVGDINSTGWCISTTLSHPERQMGTGWFGETYMFYSKVPGGDFFGSGYAPLLIDRNATTASIYVRDKHRVAINIGSSDTNATLYVGGTFENNDTITSAFDGNDGSNIHNLVALSSNNAGANSDVGFSMENKEDGFKWTFRTYRPGEAFAASKVGTGGTEFEVDNTGTDVNMTVVKMGGVVVFEDGHLVTASSRSIKEKIAPLSTKRAMEAFHKLEPVSYVYKSHKEEPVVGFIAEDVPELVAMPKRNAIDATEIVAVLTKVVQEQEKVLKKQSEKIAKLEAQQKELAAVKARLSALETVLTNIAYKEDPRTKEGLATEKSVSLIQK